MKISRVLTYRKALRMSQADMAKQLNLSVDGYAKKERGEREFKASEMQEFLEVVKRKEPSVSIEQIFFN